MSNLLFGQNHAGRIREILETLPEYSTLHGARGPDCPHGSRNSPSEFIALKA
jgi:hypothetical protein